MNYVSTVSLKTLVAMIQPALLRQSASLIGLLFLQHLDGVGIRVTKFTPVRLHLVTVLVCRDAHCIVLGPLRTNSPTSSLLRESASPIGHTFSLLLVTPFNQFSFYWMTNSKWIVYSFSTRGKKGILRVIKRRSITSLL